MKVLYDQMVDHLVNKSDSDINECEEDNKCDNGICINEHGRFTCRCNPGFVPNSLQNPTECIGMYRKQTGSEPEVKLIY